MLNVNDIVVMTQRTKNGECTFTARVTWIEDTTDKHGNPTQYFGYMPKETRIAGLFGASHLRKDGTYTPFGLVSLNVIGNQKPEPSVFWQPRPGDPGYDLVH